MNREQVTAAIRDWSALVQEAESQINAIAEITAGYLDYDAPLPCSVLALIDGYTAAIAKQIGDEGEWLNYFREECGYGSRPMSVLPDVRNTINITGPEAIAEVICWDREHGEAAR